MTSERSKPSDWRTPIRYWSGAGWHIVCYTVLYFVLLTLTTGETPTFGAMPPNVLEVGALLTAPILFVLFFGANGYYAYTSRSHEDWKCLAASTTEAQVLLNLTEEEFKHYRERMYLQISILVLAMLLPLVAWTAVLLSSPGVPDILMYAGVGVVIAILGFATIRRKPIIELLVKSEYAVKRRLTQNDFSESSVRLLLSPLYFRAAKMGKDTSPFE